MAAFSHQLFWDTCLLLWNRMETSSNKLYEVFLNTFHHCGDLSLLFTFLSDTVPITHALKYILPNSVTLHIQHSQGTEDMRGGHDSHVNA